MGDIRNVVWIKVVQKDLNKLPSHVVKKFYAWVTSIRLIGMRRIKERPSFHDEPLKGQRDGQRSVRLSRGYRIIYQFKQSGGEEFIEVMEVNRHDY